MNEHGTVVLEARGLSKHYGSVVALREVSLEVRAGETLALVGDNGAGKSTLVGLLSGASEPTSGALLHRGVPIRFSNPHEARARGIETVWQGLALASRLGVASNIFLGRERVRGWLPRSLAPLDRRAMERETARRLADLGVKMKFRPNEPIRNLSGGQRQIVAVARAAAWATDVLFMDEPTAALGVQQTQAVLDLARGAAKRGLAVVMVTHNIPHVMECADRVAVLRHGAKVADMPIGQATPELIVSYIVGAAA